MAKKKTPKNPDGAGRTSKATRETMDALFSALRTGNTRKDSCTLASISDETLARWIKGDLPADSDIEHLDFLDQLAKAELHAKNISITQVRRAAGRDWKAAAWFLRHSPSAKDEWADRSELANPGGGALGVLMYPPEKHVPGDD